MLCYLNIDVGNEYHRKVKHMIKEIRVLSKLTSYSLLHKGIDTFIKGIYLEISYMKKNYDHIVSEELIATLHKLRSTITDIKEVETKKYNFIKDDIDVLESVKQTVISINRMVNNEQHVLTERINSDMEGFKGIFKEKYKNHLLVISQINACFVEDLPPQKEVAVVKNILGDINALITGDINIDFYKVFTVKYQELIDAIGSTNELFYLFTEKSQKST